MTVPFVMNDRRAVISPLDIGRELADFAPDTIGSNKLNGNMLTNSALSLIFYGHDCFVLARDSSVFFVNDHGFGKRPTR